MDFCDPICAAKILGRALWESDAVWMIVEVLLEPIREVWIHDKGFTASRLSMMRIMARRTKAATVGA